MNSLLIKGAHVVTPGKDLGVTDVVVDGGRIASTGDTAVRGCNSPNSTASALASRGCNSPNCTLPTCLGVHLEGPFFNPAMAGAQNPAFLRDPDADFVLRLNAISRVLKVSVALFPQCFKRYVAATGWPLHEAVKAAGYNQLRSLGLTDRGEIAPGQIADLVLVDADLNPQFVICLGIPSHFA